MNGRLRGSAWEPRPQRLDERVVGRGVSLQGRADGQEEREEDRPRRDDADERARGVVGRVPAVVVVTVPSGLPVEDTNPDWRLERVTFAAAYGQERVTMYLFLPKQSQPPYQTVLFMPGSTAWDTHTTFAQANPQFSFLVRSGRAVAFPIYKGSYERSNDEYNGGDKLKSTSLWRDYVESTRQCKLFDSASGTWQRYPS